MKLTEQLRQGLLDEDDTDQSCKGFFRESNTRIMKLLALVLYEKTNLPCEISDDGWTIHSNNYKTEEGCPKSNPEAHCEIIDSYQRNSQLCVERHSQTWIKLVVGRLTITVAEFNKDLLKDEHLGMNRKCVSEGKTKTYSMEKDRHKRQEKNAQDRGMKAHWSCASEDSQWLSTE